MKTRDEQRAEESRRILSQVEDESTAQSHGFLSRQFKHKMSHLNAEDVDGQDKVEIWATKVGRLLGFIITLGIIVWLIIYLMQSQTSL